MRSPKIDRRGQNISTQYTEHVKSIFGLQIGVGWRRYMEQWCNGFVCLGDYSNKIHCRFFSLCEIIHLHFDDGILFLSGRGKH